MRYQVTVRHTNENGAPHTFKVEIEATTPGEAKKRAQAQYSDSEIKLVTHLLDPPAPKAPKPLPLAKPERTRSRSSGSSGGKSGLSGRFGTISVAGAIAVILMFKSCISSPAQAPLSTALTTEVVVPEPTELAEPQATALAAGAPIVEDAPTDAATAYFADTLPAQEQTSEQTQPAEESPPPHAEAQLPPPALRTYFALVLRPDGSEETISLSAPSAERARQVIKDYRGDPQVLNGPSIEKNW